MHVDERTVGLPFWREAVAELAAGGATMLDFLTAVDLPDEDRIALVVHVVDVGRRVRHLVGTHVDRAHPEVPSIAALYPGAGWHEREVHEMFGVTFAGNPDLRPLLTTGDAGLPLRRTTPLHTRVNAEWPGAHDPADRPPAAGVPRAGPTRVAARPRTRSGPPGIPVQWASDSHGRPGAGADPAGAP